MTMLLINLSAKSIIRSRSFSMFRSYSSPVTFSKVGAFNSALPSIQQTLNCLRFRVLCNNQEGNYNEYAVDSQDSKSREEEWLERLAEVTLYSFDYHDLTAHSYFYFRKSVLEKGTKFISLEKEILGYRDKWATYRLINKIEDVAKRLIDDNVDKKCRIFYLLERHEKSTLGTFNEAKYDECWMSLLTLSKQPLAEILRERLSEKGISTQTFSLSMKKVHEELEEKYEKLKFWSIEIVDFGPEDIISVLNNLPFSDTDFECIKIVFNIEEPENWQIKDREKN